MMVTVIVCLILTLRGLIVWQMGESVSLIKTPRHKRLAFTGFILYAAYVIYAVGTQLAVPSVNVLPLLGLLAGFVAINKYLKEVK